MNSNLLQTCLIAAVVGCVSAAVTATIVSGGSSSQPSAAAPSVGERATNSGGAVSDSALAQQLVKLENEARELHSRIEALELRPAPDARVAIAGEPDAVSLAASDAATKDASAALPTADQLQGTVAQALESIRAEEKKKAEAERAEREAARMEERLTQLAERLKLDRAQVNDMRALMLAQQQSRDELERLRRDDADREAYRIARADARAREQAELARILTPEQLKQYEARDDRRDGGDRRGYSTSANSNGNSGGASSSGTPRNRRGRGN